MTLHVHTDLEQGTDEWLAARRGIVTASVVDKLLSLEPPSALTVACPRCQAAEQAQCLSLASNTPKPIKTAHPERVALTADLPREVTVADNDTSRALTATLAAERIFRTTEDVGMTRDMWRGVLHEPFAREEYAKRHGPVEQVGLIVREEDAWTLGYSPDGLVGDDGLLEIKAPRNRTHLLTVIAGEVPQHNMAQLQAGLLVTDREWIDFMPFVGGAPLWTKRVLPDPAWHAAIVAACVAFEKNVAQLVDAYTQATTGLPITERVPTDLELVF